MITTDFGDVIAARMRAEHRTLAARWFERLLTLLPVDAREIFPSHSLLDHVPALILEIGDYLCRPEGEAIASNTAILEKAHELGALRHSQRASLHQVLREYHLLGEVLVSFVFEEVEKSPATPAAEAIQLISRLHEAVNVLSRATVEAFVGLYTQTITDQSERLDQFTRMAAHEWRQPLAALRYGVAALEERKLDQATSARTLSTLSRSVKSLVDLTGKLEAIARIRRHGDNAVIQKVPVATVAHEAARQLQEMADARGVAIRVAEPMPEITVDVGRLELTLVNLLSNAIKYSDARKDGRFVEFDGENTADGSVRIRVRDNGIGIPEAALSMIFERFTRAHTDRDGQRHVDGIGLGLSIVDDCIRAIGGRIQVQSVENEGTTFIIVLPVEPSVALPRPILPS